MERVPLFPLGLVLLPRMPLPLHIFEERYRLLFEYCIGKEKPFGVILQTGTTAQNVGCLAHVENVINRYDDGRLDVLAVGTERFLLKRTYEEKPYLEADVEIIRDTPTDQESSLRLAALARKSLEDLQDFARVVGYSVDSRVIEDLDHEELSFLMSTTDIFSIREKQELLELRNTTERMERAAHALDESRKRLTMIRNIRTVLGKNEDEDLAHLFN